MPKTKRPFVDFRAIRARITMEQVLDHYGVLATFKRTGNRLSGPCPIHGGHNPSQFRVDTDRNLWNCFSECKNGGNVLDFIARKEDMSIHDAALRACEWFGINLDGVSTDRAANAGPAEPKSERPAKNTRPVVESVSSLDDTTPNPPLKFRLEKLDRSHPYFAERGLTQETVIDFGLGYFTGDKGLMVGRVVIPITNAQSETVAYCGRLVTETTGDQPKYKLPPGFKKGLELFNLDRAIKEPADAPLIIVEGFFDAIKLHQHGCRKVVALMGCSLTAAQEELIRKHTNSHSKVIVMLDEDEAGRANRGDITLRLTRFVFVKIHTFNQEGSQPEDLNADQVSALFN